MSTKKTRCGFRLGGSVEKHGPTRGDFLPFVGSDFEGYEIDQVGRPPSENRPENSGLIGPDFGTFPFVPELSFVRSYSTL